MKQTEENREKILEIKRRQEEIGREKGLRGIKLTLSYDGTNFGGWQVQDNARTVQGEIEKVNEKIFGENSLMWRHYCCVNLIIMKLLLHITRPLNLCQILLK